MHSGAVCPGLIEATRYGPECSAISPRIPGQSAPASLKRIRGGRRRRARDRHSGAVCPGLIEAFNSSGILVSSFGRHSGAVCPGLIEAPFSFPKWNTSTSSIPGQSAPASLKRQQERRKTCRG